MSEANDPPATAGDVLGTPLSLTYQGHTHPVWRPTLRVLDRVEELVAQRAVAACERQKFLPPKVYAELKERLYAKLGAEEHATGGSLWQDQFNADGGARGLSLILFCCLAEARDRAADKSALPPAIPFEDLPAVLNEAPEAARVGRALLKGFFKLAAGKRKIPAAAVEQAMQAAETPPDGTAPTSP